MIRSAEEVPPFKVIAATLRKTTELLAQELAQPSASAPDWSELEWAIAPSVAAMQGTSTLLANRLCWSGPPRWQAFLAEQREQAKLRDARIGELLDLIDEAAQRVEIGCVALKGAALRALGLYHPGERPMGDVDLLVGSGDLGATDALLRDLDYVRMYSVPRHTVYEVRAKTAVRGFGEHVDNPLKIEVHTAVAELLPARPIDITAQLQPVRVRPGLNAYPSLAALLLHLLLHAAGNMRAHALRQIQLHDIATLASQLQEADWQALVAPHGHAAKAWWAFPPLALTARYYGRIAPPEIMRKLRRSCPYALRFVSERRCLTDVSWSNLRIHAFPGVAWSRTPLDAIRYISSRALPSRSALVGLELAVQSQPQLEQVPWYGISHGRRMLRWLFAHPPRVQTMLSVRAALLTAGVASDQADG